MTPTGRHPLASLLNLEQALDEAFDRLIDEPWGRVERPRWMPAVDLYESAEAYVVSVDLPGVPLDSVELDIEPRTIAIRGTRSASRTAASATCLHTERRYGSFRRVFPLEHEVDPDTAECTCEEGVYEVRVLKRRPGVLPENGEQENHDRG